MGYFNPEPKTRREDFFDMEEELERLSRGLKFGKLVVVSGLRRYGKTSLILTCLNEEGYDYLYIDCRLLPPGMVTLNSILKLFRDELERRVWAKRVLRRVGEISLGDVKVKFRDEETLLNILHALEGKVVVLDEAQELRRSRYRFDGILAYAYDHLNIKFVVSGSQVGLLYRFLRVDDPEAPLYGRPYIEVRLGRLSESDSRRFLLEGFKQCGVEVSEGEVEEALRWFDGVIGWLTYFGHSRVVGGERLPSIVDKASKLALSELEHALKIYGVAEGRYREVLKAIALTHPARWTQIKRWVEAKLGKIPNNTLTAIIKNLMDAGFVEKTLEGYVISDPILRNGIIKFW
ncbi:MAG: ATP-binding protein [archaeon YNP-WB-040]|nr:ATP-binding protein [Candidatus Culexarchaeum yellowstonense]